MRTVQLFLLFSFFSQALCQGVNPMAVSEDEDKGGDQDTDTTLPTDISETLNDTSISTGSPSKAAANSTTSSTAASSTTMEAETTLNDETTTTNSTPAEGITSPSNPNSSPNASIETGSTTTISTATPSATPTSSSSSTSSSPITSTTQPTASSNTQPSTTSPKSTADSSQTLTNSTETPTNSTETPTNSTETPTNSTETPTNSTQTSTNSTQTPTNSTQTPTNATQPPSSDSPQSSTSPTLATPSPTPSSSVSPSVQPPVIRISETNILLASSDDDGNMLFVELEGDPGVDVTGVVLTVWDAYKDKGLLHSHTLSGPLDTAGRLLLELGSQGQWAQNNSEVACVLLVVYAPGQAPPTDSPATKTGALDYIVYATSSDQDWPQSGLREEFGLKGKNQLILFQQSSLELQGPVSFSSCWKDESQNTGLVLTPESRNANNLCQLGQVKSFEMRLEITGEACDPRTLTPDFNTSLAVEVIRSVNAIRQCGITWMMVQDLQSSPSCKDSKTLTIPVHFRVVSAFSPQITVITDAYSSLIQEHRILTIDSHRYNITKCTSQCFPTAPPVTDSNDDKIQVTIAVVVSCIGAFLIVLLCVGLYMRRKRRGILQFRMTRLDEDDDDLIGDMDDFVGSQGPTFRNFR